MNSSLLTEGVNDQGQTLLDLEARQMSKSGRLAGTIAALTADLAATRRELNRLRRENTHLRDLCANGASETTKHERVLQRNRDNEILTMVRQQLVSRTRHG